MHNVWWTEFLFIYYVLSQLYSFYYYNIIASITLSDCNSLKQFSFNLLELLNKKIIPF